ncbi:MAG: SdiA-regulated domain-containing protein [Gemmatimonadota bacterium]
MPRSVACIGLCALALAGCRYSGHKTGGVDSTELTGRVTRLERLRHETDSASHDRPLARWLLPVSLNEISGLALTGDGRLMAHDDEQGSVWIFDYQRGVLVKQFHVGHRLQEDFEGITIVNDDIYLLASNGQLYRFREGAEGEQMRYSKEDTELGKECEFEGVAYDSTRNELELACKNVGTKKLKDDVVIYRWNLGTDGDRLSVLTIPLSQVITGQKWKEFKPSDITVDPATGNYVLLSSQQKGILVITPDGTVVAVRSLPPGHDQAEGIAITRDSILIVSDEAARNSAMITLYRWP